MDVTDLLHPERPTIDPDISVEDFAAEAEAWLDEHATKRPTETGESRWGEGDFSVSVFHAMDFETERAYIGSLRSWQQLLATRGYHAITWSRDVGGLGLSKEHARAFSRLAAHYEHPGGHEIMGVTVGLIAPTINLFGTDEQKARYVPSFLATRELCCQLFSEPGAGSDLAVLGCRAERDGDTWLVNGSKVWSSAAQFSEFGELIARTDPDAPKHAGMTAFIVPLSLPGIEVRPIKQMSGGSSFNEVFFTDVRIPDSARLGEVGRGWEVALTTLGFERDHSDAAGGSGGRTGGGWAKLLGTAQAMGACDQAVVRQALMRAYTHSRIEGFVNRRAGDLRKAGAPPGPEGSLGKLLWTEGMRTTSEVISLVLGAKLVADAGEWGTYAWAEHVLGAPGYRIAGGSDEVQRNIIGERVLGLPREPSLDKSTPWRAIPK
jgi:alkylation response protein AidB-like acyl-CoA dehydrogenase